MIVLNVTYKCRPGMREPFLDAIKSEGLDEACRSENGNLKYDYYFAADDADEMILVEHWKDAASLATHGEQLHFKRIGEIKEEYVLETIFNKYEDCKRNGVSPR